MKFLVLGCNGMAGHMISIYLEEQGYDVTGFAFYASRYVKSIVGDARDLDFVQKVIHDGHYDSVVNCIGILNQFAEQDKSNATFLNAFFPHYLADITRDTGTQVIQISTDCVFSGKRGSYTEGDIRDGESFYARTKALGELEDEKNITLRTSFVGPDIKPAGIGLMNWFMQQKDQTNGFTKAIWTGLTTLQLAKTIEAAALQKANGLYHAVPAAKISKYELLLLFNCYLRNNELTINPVEGMAVDKSLINTRHGFNCQVPVYETMLSELAEWMHAHKELYPHYSL